jgi:hypothetical protein
MPVLSLRGLTLLVSHTVRQVSHFIHSLQTRLHIPQHMHIFQSPSCPFHALKSNSSRSGWYRASTALFKANQTMPVRAEIRDLNGEAVQRGHPASLLRRTASGRLFVAPGRRATNTPRPMPASDSPQKPNTLDSLRALIRPSQPFPSNQDEYVVIRDGPSHRATVVDPVLHAIDTAREIVANYRNMIGGRPGAVPRRRDGMRAPNWMRRRRSWAADIITDGSEVEEVEEGGESGEVEGGDGVERYAAETQGEDLQWSFQRHAEIRREAMRRWSCGSGMGVSSERDSGGEYGEKELKRRVQSGVGRNFESWYEENGEWMKV